MRFTPKKGSLYRKYLITVLLAACVPILLMGTLLYAILTNRMVEEMNSSHKKQLNQTTQRFDDYLSQLELFLGRLTLEPALNYSLESTDFVQNFEKTKEIDRSLSLMQNSNPLIQEVALYVRSSGTLLSSEAGFRQVQSPQDREPFEKLLSQDKDIFWNDAVRSTTASPPRQAMIVKLKQSIYDVHAYGAVIVYINNKFLNQILYNMAAEDGFAVLLDPTGSVVASSSMIRSGQLSPTLIKEAVTSRQKQVSQTYKLNDRSYSVSYGTMSRLGNQWTYLSATPVSSIMKPVDFIFTMIAGISLAGLMTALPLSWFASKSMYKPLRRLIGLFHKDSEMDASDEAVYIERQWTMLLKQQQSLETKVKESIPSLRDSLLMQFLMGHLFYLNEEELLHKLKVLDWDVENHRFSFIVFQLSSMIGKESVSNEDEPMISTAHLNIIQELCSAKFNRVYVQNYHDVTVGAMIALPWDVTDEDAHKQLLELAETASATLSSVLKMQVTVVIGKTADTLVEAPDYLEETKNALKYRDLNVSHQILLVHELNPAGGSSITYPFEIEKSIIFALRTGNEEEAFNSLQLFMNTVQAQSGSPLLIQQASMKLLGSVHEAVLKSGVNMMELYEGANLYEDIMQMTEPSEVLEWFKSCVFAPFLTAVHSSQELQVANIVQQVIQHLEQYYMDDLTFEAIADAYGIGMSKLSRAFKQATGATYTDYLIRLRLERCKELLVTTDLKIHEIADMLRYQPAYLIRIFKKFEQMTPGQYREHHTA